MKLSKYSRDLKPGFIVIPQNGIPIITRTGETSDPISQDFVNSIDGWGIEDLLYGADEDDKKTDPSMTAYVQSYIDIAKKMNKKILVTDYCSNPSYVSDSYHSNNLRGHISFVAGRELDAVPQRVPFNENANNVLTLNDAKNFLYLLNAGSFVSKTEYLKATRNTNYDALIIDPFVTRTKTLNQTEVKSLKTKLNNGKRLVIAYMSIGEAETYRYYWQSGWKTGNPAFLEKLNPSWEGNYKVNYWDPNWQRIIYGDNNSFLKKIIDAGFDGVYLDIIDGYYYFEEKFNFSG